MQAALNFVHPEPPGFAFLHFGVQFTSARFTTYAHKSFFFKRMLGQLMFLLILPDHTGVPIQHWVKSEAAMFGRLLYFHSSPDGTLVSTHAVDPYVMG